MKSRTKPATRITLIGGGTGSFTLLQELKHLTPNITALVNMSDDGGSTGVLRDELGVLPPGDVRQCLVALSNMPEIRDLFNYRFGKGFMAGHSLGNIILTGLELQYDDFGKAVELASKLLQITGKVVPITLQKHDLVMQDDGELVRGEYHIGHREIHNQDARIALDPAVDLNPEAREAIINCDLLVIAPGNLYGSLLPALGPIGIRKAFQDSKATKVAITNLVTKPKQTDHWHVVDYVKKLEEYLGRTHIDVVLYNKRLPSKELLDRYAEDGEFPVAIDKARFTEIKARAVGANLVAQKPFTQDKNDTKLRRTLIRHDAAEVCRQLMKIRPARKRRLPSPKRRIDSSGANLV